jgi:hypothetical protein
MNLLRTRLGQGGNKTAGCIYITRMVCLSPLNKNAIMDKFLKHGMDKNKWMAWAWMHINVNINIF